MAVNTATRRFSMMGFGRTSGRPLPPPDGTIGAGDRQMLLGLYAMLASAGAALVYRFLKERLT